MIATYPAYLTPDGRVDWRGEAPKPFSGAAPVLISFVQVADDAAEGFEGETPNAETLAAMEDAVLGRNLSGPFKSAEDMLADILKED
jgi:hypothetical protein